MDTKERNTTFPSGLEAFFLIVVLFAIEYVVGAAFHDFGSSVGIENQDMWGIITLLGNGILFSGLLVYKRLSYASLFHSAKHSAISTIVTLSLPILLITPALTIAILTVYYVLVLIFPFSPWHELFGDQMMSDDFASIVYVCVLAPILEEMLFRGIILRSFLLQYSRPASILGSAALFGLAHLNIYQFAVGLILGSTSGWLYERSRSLWPCILLHATYNSIVTWQYFYEKEMGVHGPPEISPYYWVTAFVFGLVGSTLLQRLLTPAKK